MLCTYAVGDFRQASVISPCTALQFRGSGLGLILENSCLFQGKVLPNIEAARLFSNRRHAPSSSNDCSHSIWLNVRASCFLGL